MTDLLGVLESVNDYLWTIPFSLIIVLGLYCTWKFRFIQLTHLREMVRITFSKDERGKGDYSAFHIFCVSMGNRIGVGNITGPVLAILMGGPGAIFWMWIFALIGGATSFLETTISQIYKERNKEGGFFGGPAYNILHGLANPKLALVVAAVMFGMHFIGFASMEACSISSAMTNVFPFDYNVLVFSLFLVGLTVLMMVGGFKRISRVSVWFVPLMALGWLLICIISIALSKGGIGNAFAMIFEYAFNVPAAVGGGVGAMLMIGMKRGILSNEAGLGTSTYISSMADAKHPATQGLSQSFGVLIDTIVSTMTALVVLSMGSYEDILATKLESQALLQHAFQITLGDAAPFIVMIFVFVFAFSSLMGDFVIGSSNFKFITKKKKPYLIACVCMALIIFFTAFVASDRMYVIVDIFLGLTATVNCITMFMLSKVGIQAYRDYRRQQREGKKQPEFTKDCIDDPKGITAWGE